MSILILWIVSAILYQGIDGALQIWGDNDNLLAATPYMDYKSDSITITVDISGQQHIKLTACGYGYEDSYVGNPFPLMIKDAYFK